MDEPAQGVDPLLCEPDIGDYAAGISSPYSHSMELGAASAILSVGSSPAEPDALRLVALGSAPDGDLEGFVQIMEANLSSSQFDGSSANVMQIVPSDVPAVFGGASGGVEYQFGAELAAGNINDCREAWPGGPDYACGEELLIGAPDTGTGSTVGGVYLFEPNNDPSVEPILVYAGEVVDPTPMLGSEFGAAIAIASRDEVDEDAPWDRAELAPEWIAVGAPGDERVEIFEVDPTAAERGSSPFTWVMSIPNPNPTDHWGFGSEIIVDNVDNDGQGWPDLIVAAPYGTSGGAVWVFRGQGGYGVSTPVYPIGLNVRRNGDTSLDSSPMDDDFGHSLASGPIIYSPDDELMTKKHGLLVGIPGYDVTYGTTKPDAGAVCQFLIDTDFAEASLLAVQSTTCLTGSSIGLSSSGNRLGESVAVGNFVASDKNGQYYSDASLLNDIAVGIPGMGSDQGAVALFAAQPDGLDPTGFVSAVVDPFGGPGYRFGESMSSGYIAERLWGDLVISQPANDMPALTRATATNTSSIGACPELTGWWKVDTQKWKEDTTEFVDRTAEIVVWEDAGETVVLFQKPLYLNVSEAGGSEPCMMDLLDTSVNYGIGCDALLSAAVALGEVDQIQYAANSIPSGTSLYLPDTCSGAFDSSTNSYVWTDVPVGDIILDSLDEGLLAILAEDSETDLRNATATVSIEVISAATNEVELDVQIDWPGDVWAHISAERKGVGCSFKFTGAGGADCDEYSPVDGTTGNPPQIPADGVRISESVCEDQ